MTKYGDYVIAYFDANGKFLGYYGEDSHSGGYPYITDSTRQAVAMSEDRALKTAEESFRYPYSKFNEVYSCVFGKFEIPNGKVVRRDTYEFERRQREIEQRKNQILALQREIEELQGAGDEANISSLSRCK